MLGRLVRCMALVAVQRLGVGDIGVGVAAERNAGERANRFKNSGSHQNDGGGNSRLPQAQPVDSGKVDVAAGQEHRDEVAVSHAEGDEAREPARQGKRLGPRWGQAEGDRDQTDASPNQEKFPQCLADTSRNHSPR